MASAGGTYSRIVGFVKVALPILALILLSTVFLVQKKDTFEGGLIFTQADRDTLREGLTIRDPRFGGVTRDGDTFTITAVTAVPDGVTPKEVAMTGIFSRTEYATGGTTELRSQNGVANLRDQTLALSGGMEIQTSNGYTVIAPGAFANMVAGTIVSEGPVTAEGPAGKLEAGAMTYATVYAGDGETIATRTLRFNNGVTMKIKTADKGQSE